jgi:hypothetical protein
MTRARFALHVSALAYDSANGPIKERTSAAIRGVTTDQRIDWASLMASDLAVELVRIEP